MIKRRAAQAGDHAFEDLLQILSAAPTGALKFAGTAMQVAGVALLLPLVALPFLFRLVIPRSEFTPVMGFRSRTGPRAPHASNEATQPSGAELPTYRTSADVRRARKDN